MKGKGQVRGKFFKEFLTHEKCYVTNPSSHWLRFIKKNPKINRPSSCPLPYIHKHRLTLTSLPLLTPRPPPPPPWEMIFSKTDFTANLHFSRRIFRYILLSDQGQFCLLIFAISAIFKAHFLVRYLKFQLHFFSKLIDITSVIGKMTSLINS